MEKTAEDDGPAPTFADRGRELNREKMPAHHDFRKRVSTRRMEGNDTELGRISVNDSISRDLFRDDRV